MNTSFRLRDERGTANTLLIPLILTIVLLVAVSIFAVWAFMSRQDYKENADEKITAAVTIAKKQTAADKDKLFAEAEKLPLTNYQGPDALGSILVKYPKTWSAYVDDTGKGSSPLDAYFHPTTVPGVSSKTSYALRVQVLERSFSDELKSFDSQVKAGKASSKPYEAVNVPGVIGARIEGEIASKQQGIVILLPLRDKTIKIYTMSNLYYNDFNNNILPNFKFSQ